MAMAVVDLAYLWVSKYDPMLQRSCANEVAGDVRMFTTEAFVKEVQTWWFMPLLAAVYQYLPEATRSAFGGRAFPNASSIRPCNNMAI